MEAIIEKGIPMPTNVRGSRGNSRAQLVNGILPKLVEPGQSYLFTMPTQEKAEKERREFVWLANKHGKANNREYVVAAVAPTPAVPADEAKGIAARPGKPAGIRVWLKAILPAEEVAEQGGEANGTETGAKEVTNVQQQGAEQAPEVAA